MSSKPRGVLAVTDGDDDDEGVEAGDLRAEVLGRMWAALILVTSDGVGMGGLGRDDGGVGGMSRAAARHDITSPSGASVLAVVVDDDDDADAGVVVEEVVDDDTNDCDDEVGVSASGGNGGKGLLVSLAGEGTEGGGLTTAAAVLPLTASLLLAAAPLVSLVSTLLSSV